MKNVGIFSGSFNPIHIGHLALANWICEYGGMDEVWFLVTPQNPLKEQNELLDDNLRYELVKEAVATYPRFKASNIEFSLPRPSYTIDTIDELKKQYPQHTFHLIMGADNWKNIHRWKESGRLIAECPILVYPRKGDTINISIKENNVHLISAPEIEISSTFIRESIRENKDIRFFLPNSSIPYVSKIREALCRTK
jgi:nicotinate (nicotinamide) nucleotide adenylyltransferase